ncbi:hypothetical protein GF412_05220 [Candidatus Micrarchaeota archaeon]|nr:hypothetical protein [Candidatus Micrarchaeota archaeon]MBD3418354.1 hypothetical protein [Candidatus Micrarchaeota archaeon]
MGKESEDAAIIFCPNCGFVPHSGDYLNIESKNEVHSLSIKPVEGTYVCSQCKYRGSLFSVPEPELYKLQFDLDEIDAPLKHAQKGSGRFFIYVLSFLAILFVIFQTSSLLLAGALSLVLVGAIIYTELTARVR